MGDAYSRLLAKRSGLTAEPAVSRTLPNTDHEPELLPETSFWLVQCPCCLFPVLARNPHDRMCPGCDGRGATGCPNHFQP